MAEASVKNMMGFLGKKVIVCSETGFAKEGKVIEVNEGNLIMEVREYGKTTLALFNKSNIFMIEEA